MKILLAITAIILSICFFSGAAQAAQTVVTFEDINTVSTSSPLYATGDVADGYNGISGWSNIGQAWEYLDTSFNAGQIGSKFFYGSSGSLSFDSSPVVFEGTYFQSFARDTENTLAAIELYYQGVLVHSISDPLAPVGMVWVASGYSGLVDEIYIRGGGEGFNIDNLAFSTVAVPEPGMYAMFLVGIGLIGVMKRRQRVAQSLGWRSLGLA